MASCSLLLRLTAVGAAAALASTAPMASAPGPQKLHGFPWKYDWSKFPTVTQTPAAVTRHRLQLLTLTLPAQPGVVCGQRHELGVARPDHRDRQVQHGDPGLAGELGWLLFIGRDRKVLLTLPASQHLDNAASWDSVVYLQLTQAAVIKSAHPDMPVRRIPPPRRRHKAAAML